MFSDPKATHCGTRLRPTVFKDLGLRLSRCHVALFDLICDGIVNELLGPLALLYEGIVIVDGDDQ